MGYYGLPNIRRRDLWDSLQNSPWPWPWPFISVPANLTPSFLLTPQEPSAGNQSLGPLDDLHTLPGLDLHAVDLKPRLATTEMTEQQPLYQLMKRYCPVTFGLKTREVEDGSGRMWMDQRESGLGGEKVNVWPCPVCCSKCTSCLIRSLCHIYTSICVQIIVWYQKPESSQVYLKGANITSIESAFVVVLVHTIICCYVFFRVRGNL